MKERTQFGLLGKTLGHSHSPLIYKSLGICDYRLFEVPPQEVETFLQRGDLAGLNVTIPYKKTVLPYCHSLSDIARRLGNVNTLRFDRQGRICGDNTDYEGLRQTLVQANFDLAGKKVVILGTGGAARTGAAVAQDLGAAYVVHISRTGEDHYGNLDRHDDARFLINATPVGMYPHWGESPAPLEPFPRLEGVADFIYNPLRTSLMQQAARRGIPAVGGLLMLAAQGCAAAGIFLGRPPERAETRQVYSTLLQQVENILLVGMPGSGKTVVGKAVAKQMNRRFADLDDLIQKETGRLPAQIIGEEGEEAFRDVESAILERTAKESGLVIATGGGAVLREENRKVMQRNSRVYWLCRPLEELAVEGRPLSKNLPELYARRLPAYQETADVAVKVLQTPRETARQIVEEFYEYTGAQRPEPESFGDAGAGYLRQPNL